MPDSFPAHRSVRIALCCTAAFIAFAAALAMVVPPLLQSYEARNGKGEGVTYRFEHRQCTGGESSSFSHCTWRGTVYDDDEAVAAENVIFSDKPPQDVQVGTEIPALWSPVAPGVAFDYHESRAWLNSVASASMAVFGLLLFGYLSIFWWRRTFNERRDRSAKKSVTKAREREPELTA